MFLHAHLVGNEIAKTKVERYIKGRKKRIEIECSAVVKDYSLNINGIDKSDHDRCDISVTIRSIGWYLRIWLWTMEMLIHCVYVVVCYCANEGIRDDWKQYTYKIRLGWLEEFVKKTIWDEGKKYVPCNCRFYFFCNQSKSQEIPFCANKNHPFVSTYVFV